MSIYTLLAIAVPSITSVLIVWISLHADILRGIKSKNFELSQTVFIDIYSSIFQINKLCKAIYTDLWVIPNADSISKMEQVVNKIDAYEIEARVSLFGDKELIGLIENWADAKESFLAGFDLSHSNIMDKTEKNLGHLRTGMKNDLDKCLILENNLREKILSLIQYR